MYQFTNFFTKLLFKECNFVFDLKMLGVHDFPVVNLGGREGGRERGREREREREGGREGISHSLI